MLFYSPDFLPFFLITFCLYWALPARGSWRTWTLLVASFYFYATWNEWLAFLICVTSVVDYAVGLGLDGSRSARWRKTLLGASLVMNLGLLAYFKYMNFFLDSLEASLRAAGVAVTLPTLQVILPIGISFYTFEAINYTVDVYRHRAPAERRLERFLLFITFFPHLVAGPIVRAKDFLPQIARPKRWDWRRLQLGCEFFLLGMFKKLVIADRLSLAVDPVFRDPSGFSTPALWLAILAYAVQIYCDFSGYSDMAIGLAHSLGFKLGKNFDMPYLAANISEFWRRWHISLSSWLRDYLFIPLGGSRGTRWETCRNLLLTMTLGGLWHGASWNFVWWGVLHGVYLVVHRLFQDAKGLFPGLDRALAGLEWRLASAFVTFLAVALGWILFRAPTVSVAGEVFQGLFTWRSGAALAIPTAGVLSLLWAVALAHAVGQWPAWRRGVRHAVPAPVLGLAYAVAWACLVILVPDNSQPFIYFQF